MASGGPRVSISQISTFSASFADDLAAYSAAGLDGIGIWELKLGDGPDDAERSRRSRASGLDSASAVPVVPSILPLPLLGGPEDPGERLEAMLASLHRLAPFTPSGIVCLTGTGLGREPDEAAPRRRRRPAQLAAEAEGLGLRISLEPYQRDGGEEWTIATTIPDAVDLIRDAGDSPALQLQFDVWHLWNTETLFDDIANHVGRFAGVHVCDVREPTRGWADRALPDREARRCPASSGTRRRRLGRPLRHRDLLRRRHLRVRRTTTRSGGSRPRPQRSISARPSSRHGRHAGSSRLSIDPPRRIPRPSASAAADSEGVEDETTEFPPGAHDRRGRWRRRARRDRRGPHDRGHTDRDRLGVRLEGRDGAVRRPGARGREAPRQAGQREGRRRRPQAPDQDVRHAGQQAGDREGLCAAS